MINVHGLAALRRRYEKQGRALVLILPGGVRGMVRMFTLVLALAVALALFERSVQKSGDDAEASLEYLAQFDAQPKADRIRICKAVMKAREGR